jgi:hypothetical protein
MLMVLEFSFSFLLWCFCILIEYLGSWL